MKILTGAVLLGMILITGMYFNKSDSNILVLKETDLNVKSEVDSSHKEELSGQQKNKRVARKLKNLSEDSLKIEIHKALAEFWEEDYELPVVFIEQVQKYLNTWVRSWPLVKKANHNKKSFGGLIFNELEKENLPPAFIYLAMHESSLDTSIASKAGARGIWQLMPLISRHYGLKVPPNWRELPPVQDERTNPLKSTRAAIKYLKDLDEEFGSFFLAMVAYNAGERRVRKEIRKIEDPMNSKDFWYMYRNGLLPRQTINYIPKTVATIIISKSLEASRVPFSRE